RPRADGRVSAFELRNARAGSRFAVGSNAAKPRKACGRSRASGPEGAALKIAHCLLAIALLVVSGCEGPAGAPGADGSNGQTGARGPKGSKGGTGGPGDPGDAGDHGDAGTPGRNAYLTGPGLRLEVKKVEIQSKKATV